MGINVEWIINKAKEKIYAVSHAKAVIRGDHTIDEDLTNLENTMKNHIHDERYYTESEVDTRLDDKIDKSLRGIAGGIAELDDTGRIPSAQLPSYVDDVLEYTSISVFPTTGEEGKIYVDKTTNLTYRWSGTDYVGISQSLALGETSSTAYAGDKGKNLATNLSSHVNNADIHVTAEEKAGWDAKAELSDIPTTLPANGGNADSLNGFTVPNSGLDLLGNPTASGGRPVLGAFDDSNSATAFYDIRESNGDIARLQMNPYQDPVFKVYKYVASTDTWSLKTVGNADTLDGKHAKEFMSGYTYVVDSDETLRALVENDEGNDYSYVLIKKGSWSYELTEEKNLISKSEVIYNGNVINYITTLAGINIDNTGTKMLIGEPGAELNFSANNLNNYRIHGIYQYTKSTSTELWFELSSDVVSIENICIKMSSTGSCSVRPTSGPLGSFSYGISGAFNVKHCKVYGNMTSTDNPGYCIAYGYYHCISCIDCEAFITTDVVSVGFSQCINLNSCKSKVQGNSTAGVCAINAFDNCKNCINCVAHADDGLNTAEVSGFRGCTHLLGCFSSAWGSKFNVSAYYSCEEITNCYAKGPGSLFRGCINISGCYTRLAGLMAGSSSVHYSRCTNVNNCTVYLYNNDNSVYNSICAFEGCTGMLMNRVIQSSSTSFTAYSGCYSGHDKSDDTYLCADTANGGWNAQQH